MNDPLVYRWCQHGLWQRKSIWVPVWKSRCHRWHRLIWLWLRWRSSSQCTFYQCTGMYMLFLFFCSVFKLYDDFLFFFRLVPTPTMVNCQKFLQEKIYMVCMLCGLRRLLVKKCRSCVKIGRLEKMTSAINSAECEGRVVWILEVLLSYVRNAQITLPCSVFISSAAEF